MLSNLQQKCQGHSKIKNILYWGKHATLKQKTNDNRSESSKVKNDKVNFIIAGRFLASKNQIQLVI